MDLNLRLELLVMTIEKLKHQCYPDYSLSIGFLTIFAQSQEDYRELSNELSQLGTESLANNGVKFTLAQAIRVKDTTISVVRVRKPDIHRTELGCCDLHYEAADYPALREIAFAKGYDVILRKEYEMIELATFDIAAYAYIVKDVSSK